MLEERITSQSRKLEQLALNVIERDKRLAALEGRMEGFLAAASALAGVGRPAKVTGGTQTDDPTLLPPPSNP
ncbi:MAG: hypothetical protein ACLQIQ_10710 [Beijerinckiaceae bacterium]